MNITINNKPVTLPKDIVTVGDLADMKGLTRKATAIAVNDMMILRDNWNKKRLAEGDRVLIIEAAFGG